MNRNKLNFNKILLIIEFHSNYLIHNSKTCDSVAFFRFNSKNSKLLDIYPGIPNESGRVFNSPLEKVFIYFWWFKFPTEHIAIHLYDPIL